MSKGVKDTEGKIALNLIPPHALEEVAKIRMYGNQKYGDPWSWLTAGVPKEAFIEAAKRHLNALAKGELLDRESKLSHLAHATTSLMMALELDERQSNVKKFKEEFTKLMLSKQETTAEQFPSEEIDHFWRNIWYK